MRKLILFASLLLFVNNVHSQWKSNDEIKKDYLKLVKKELKTESDGFQWYLYSYCFKWDTKIVRCGVTNVDGVELSSLLSSNEFDWKISGYKPSHKVFVTGCMHNGGGLARGGFYGEIFTLDGRCIAKIGGASSVEYLDHGIINADEYSGVFFNNKVVIPFNKGFRSITYSDYHYYATKSDYKGENKTYYVYSDNGNLIGGNFIEKQLLLYDDIIPFISEVFFYDGEKTYDQYAKFLFYGKWDGRSLYDYSNRSLYLIVEYNNLYGTRGLDGREIIPYKYNSITKCDKPGLIIIEIGNKKGLSDYLGKIIIQPLFAQLEIIEQYIKVQGFDNKYGLYSLDGDEILAPEFEDCNLIGDNSIKFKIHGHWGVMSRKTGKVYIPESRQYTKLEYNKTFKKFYFEKKVGDVLYKGECNVNGVQTSIEKEQTTTSDNTSAAASPQKTSSNSSSTATSSSSKPASSNSEPGLIFKGPYTQDCGSGPMYMFISVYEDRLYDGSTVFQYKSTNSSGERIYAGPGMFGSYSKWTVNTKTQNVRLVNTYSSQWGSSTKSCSVSKGHDFDQRVSFGSGYAPSTYSGSGSGSNSSSGTSTNPVQPHQKTKSCTLCNGSGKCANCNGKGWHYGYGGSTVNCSNCSRNGRCPSCGGSGKKTTTEYY